MRGAAWAEVAERGSLAGLWLTVRFYRVFGRRLSEYFVLLIVTYFFLTDPRGRRASRRYLQRLHGCRGGTVALGHAPTLRDSFRHYREFGLVALDRLRFAVGHGADVELVFSGREHLSQLVSERRGAVLLGAHLGSFDALRLLAARTGVVVTVLMNTRYSARINSVLRRLDPEADVRVVESTPGSLETVFHLKACVERGEFIAILGDRIGQGARARLARAPFLGADASFPQGPFVLAETLQCPLLLMIALRRGPGRYEIFAEPLADGNRRPRAERADRVGELVGQYARRLEAYCLRAPYQWFNFFDFWGDEICEAQPKASRAGRIRE